MGTDQTIWRGSISWKVAMSSWKSWVTLGLYAVWKRMGTRYRLTSETVTASYGVVSKEANTISLQDIRDIRLSQSVTERLLGIGTLEISTAGTGGTEVVMENVPKPGWLKEQIKDAKRDAERVEPSASARRE